MSNPTQSQMVLRRLFVVALAVFGFAWASFSLSAGAWFGVLAGVLIMTGCFAWAVRPTAAADDTGPNDLPILERV